MLKKTFSRYWETVRDILYFCWKGDVPREMRRPRAPISLVARSSLTHLQHLSSLPHSDIANRHQSHFYCLLVWRLRVWLERCDWVCSPEVWLPGDWESSEAPPTSSLHQPPSPDQTSSPPPLYILTSTCSMLSIPQHGSAGLYAANQSFVVTS